MGPRLVKFRLQYVFMLDDGGLIGAGTGGLGEQRGLL